jgi:hypothetical protein
LIDGWIQGGISVDVNEQVPTFEVSLSQVAVPAHHTRPLREAERKRGQATTDLMLDSFLPCVF